MSAERPVGNELAWRAARRPERGVLAGRYVLLRPPQADEDAEALYAESHPPAVDPGHWTYMPNGPYRDAAELREWLKFAEDSEDPFVFVLVRPPTGIPPASPPTTGSRPSTG